MDRYAGGCETKRGGTDRLGKVGFGNTRRAAPGPGRQYQEEALGGPRLLMPWRLQ